MVDSVRRERDRVDERSTKRRNPSMRQSISHYSDSPASVLIPAEDRNLTLTVAGIACRTLCFKANSLF